MNLVMMDVKTGKKIDLSGGIPELTLEDVQAEPVAGSELYMTFLGEPLEITLQAKIPTLPRQWRRPYVRKFGYRWAKKTQRERRIAKVKQRWRERSKKWPSVNLR